MNGDFIAWTDSEVNVASLTSTLRIALRSDLGIDDDTTSDSMDLEVPADAPHHITLSPRNRFDFRARLESHRNLFDVDGPTVTSSARSFDGPLPPASLALPSLPTVAYDNDFRWDSDSDNEGALTTPTRAGFGTAAVLSFTPRARTPALGTRTASATPTTQARAAAAPPPSAAPSARTARAATPARPATAPPKDGDTAQDQDSEFLTTTKRDPPTPHTAARTAQWGVLGSPWPGRGLLDSDGEGSFCMDGRSLRAD
ncbi:hypothetical protein B0H14DRAFT_3459674 [Mycena olivaceomarginata]|nr:hypothetical protein B0H14DRAFT_3459674 [Mycena olivaceomarginata]